MPDLLLPDSYDPKDLKRLLDDRLRQIGTFIEHTNLSSDMDAGGYRIEQVADPTSELDAVNLRSLRLALLGMPRRNSGTSGTSGGTDTATTTTGGQQELILSRSGTLAIQSNAFPLAQFPVSRKVAMLRAIGKQAPVASGTEQLTFEIQIAGTTWTSLNVASGQKSASKSASGLAAIQANALITINVLSVGLTFPGADWSLILELS